MQEKNRLKHLKTINSAEQFNNSSPFLRFISNPVLFFKEKNYFKKIRTNQVTGLDKFETFWGTTLLLPVKIGAEFIRFGIPKDKKTIELTRFLLNRLNPGDVFIDAGAGFGYYTALAANIMNNEGIIFSAEASKEIFDHFTKNIEGLTVVRPINRALHFNDNEELKFFENSAEKHSLNSLNPSIKAEETKETLVQSSRIDSLLPFFLLSAKGLSPKANYFVNIGCIGSDKEILEGFSKFLENPELKGRIFIIFNNDLDNITAEFLSINGFRPHFVSKKGTLSALSGNKSTMTELTVYS